MNIILGFLLVILSSVLLGTSLFTQNNTGPRFPQTVLPSPLPTNTTTLTKISRSLPTKSPIVTATPTQKIINHVTWVVRPTPVPTDDTPWGVSKQINDTTWTMKLADDPVIAGSKEIFDALNQYRQVHGSQILTWDEKLSAYAQTRAVYLNQKKTVDQHQGFNDYLTNQDGFNKLGFSSLGENISYGFRLNGVHLIEWVYAGDKPHDDNQLNNKWNYVGIGVDGLATCLIFGTGKF